MILIVISMCRYCDPSYAFPSQQDVITFAVQTSVAFLQAYPDALIAVGSYTIGKERLFHGMIIFCLLSTEFFEFKK